MTGALVHYIIDLERTEKGDFQQLRRYCCCVSYGIVNGGRSVCIRPSATEAAGVQVSCLTA